MPDEDSHNKSPSPPIVLRLRPVGCENQTYRSLKFMTVVWKPDITRCCASPNRRASSLCFPKARLKFNITFPSTSFHLLFASISLSMCPYSSRKILSVIYDIVQVRSEGGKYQMGARTSSIFRWALKCAFDSSSLTSIQAKGLVIQLAVVT